MHVVPHLLANLTFAFNEARRIMKKTKLQMTLKFNTELTTCSTLVESVYTTRLSSFKPELKPIIPEKREGNGQELHEWWPTWYCPKQNHHPRDKMMKIIIRWRSKLRSPKTIITVTIIMFFFFWRNKKQGWWIHYSDNFDELHSPDSELPFLSFFVSVVFGWLKQRYHIFLVASKHNIWFCMCVYPCRLLSDKFMY